MHGVASIMQSCIDECLRCYEICFGMAMSHCLDKGGKHVAPPHLRMMMACAEMCRASAHLMLAQAPQHKRACELCADICEACAASCLEIGDMQECVDECRRCAQSCRKMAA
jgi:hypothetical protein